MSQTELARKMADRGWPYHQQTVGKLESGSRSVRLGEAKALAQILRTSLDRLTRPTDEARITESLLSLYNQAHRAAIEILHQTEQLLKLQENLNMTATMAEAIQRDGRGGEELGRLIREARRVGRLRPEQQVEGGRLEYEDHRQAQAYVDEMQADREAEQDEEEP